MRNMLTSCNPLIFVINGLVKIAGNFSVMFTFQVFFHMRASETYCIYVFDSGMILFGEKSTHIKV